MSDQHDLDTWLAGRFEQERRHVPDDAFVAATMRQVRTASRRKEVLRIGLRIAVLVAAIAGSPWLIEGASRLNAMLESAHPWTLGMPGTWILGFVAIVVVVAMRVRGR